MADSAVAAALAELAARPATGPLGGPRRRPDPGRSAHDLGLAGGRRHGHGRPRAAGPARRSPSTAGWRSPTRAARCSTRPRAPAVAPVRPRRGAGPGPPGPRGISAPASPRPDAGPCRRGGAHRRSDHDADGQPTASRRSTASRATRGATTARPTSATSTRATLEACGSGPVHGALWSWAARSGSSPPCSPPAAALISLDAAPTAVPRPGAPAGPRRPSRSGWATSRDDIPAGPFDLVVASEILYYLPDPQLDETLVRLASSARRRAAGWSPCTGARRARSGRTPPPRSTPGCASSAGCR